MKLNIAFMILLFSSAALFAQEVPLPAKPKQKTKAADTVGKKNPEATKITANQALDGLISWDKKLKTLQADFTQTTDFEGTPISSSEGRIYKQDNNI